MYEKDSFRRKRRNWIHKCEFTKFNYDAKSVVQIVQMKYSLTIDIKVVTQLASLM